MYITHLMCEGTGSTLNMYPYLSFMFFFLFVFLSFLSLLFLSLFFLYTSCLILFEVELGSTATLILPQC